MLFRVRKKTNINILLICLLIPLLISPFYAIHFYFSNIFHDLSRRGSFLNVNFRDISSEINFTQKVEIQSAIFEYLFTLECQF